MLNLTSTRRQEDRMRMLRIILAKDPIKKILLSYVGKASRLRMRTASLKTSPLAKTKIRYRGCMGNGLPRPLVQGGGIRTSVIQRGGKKSQLEFDS